MSIHFNTFQHISIHFNTFQHDSIGGTVFQHRTAGGIIYILGIISNLISSSVGYELYLAYLPGLQLYIIGKNSNF